MSKVLAKFRMTECISQREIEYAYDEKGAPIKNHDGSYKRVNPSLVSHIKFTAVQGEPFGKYTPSGTIDMYVKNGAAAQIFQDAWDAHVRSHDPNEEAPEFYVMFQHDQGLGWEA